MVRLVRLNTAGVLPDQPKCPKPVRRSKRSVAAPKIEDQPAAPVEAQSATATVDQVNAPAASTPATDAPVTEVLVSPIDGQCAEANDIDGLIDLYEQLDRADKQVYAVKLRIRQLLQGMTEGDTTTKTRRVRGQRRQAKVEMPDDSWDQSVLKEVWNSFDAYRDEFLRIDRLAPKMKEVKKLANMSGPDGFRLFRDMLLGANRGPSGVATIKVEK